MSDPSLAAPADWAAIVFGQRDVTAYPDGSGIGVPPGDHVLVGPGFVASFVGGREIDTTPAPTWRTVGDYHDTRIELVLGRPQADSPAWLAASHLREGALQPGESGVVSGVIPLAWLSAVVLPTDFSATELAAQALIATALNSGQRIEAVRDGNPAMNSIITPDGHRFWPSAAPRSPLATPPTYLHGAAWGDPGSYDANAIVGTITQAFALTVDRVSMSLLAVARALSLKEVLLSAVYV
jgi:hypothetical protein